jgi:hypothetical protein
MNSRARTLIHMHLYAAVAASLVGCASEFATDPTRPRPTRAVASPTDNFSTNNEYAQADPNTMPLVEVGLPNTREEQPTVRTAVDNLAASQLPAATAPATGPATLPAPTHVHPVFGPVGQ